jgi:predicted RNase H-like nuclease
LRLGDFARNGFCSDRLDLAKTRGALARQADQVLLTLCEKCIFGCAAAKQGSLVREESDAANPSPTPEPWRGGMRNHTAQVMMIFLGVDLGWYGKPTGLAAIEPISGGLRLRSLTRLEPVDEIMAWIETETGNGGAVAGVDAPLVIPNASGIRTAERELNRDFRRFHAGCHAANLGRPFAAHVTAFSRRLETLGFHHGAGANSPGEGRFQIEVHPHAAAVSLFRLPRIVKYKRGPRADRARELRRLRSLMLQCLPQLDPPLDLHLPRVPSAGDLKPVEDQIDAVLCAYIAAHWWYWRAARNRIYGSAEAGYIVVPIGGADHRLSSSAQVVE